MANFVLIDRLSLIVKLELVLRPAHAKYFEPIDFRNEFCRAFGQQFWKLLQENVWEACAKIRSVDIELLLSRDVHVLTARAVHFYSGGGEFLRDANGQNIVPFAKDSRTVTKCAKHVFLFHHGQASWSQNESGMNEAIEVHCGLVNLQEVLIIEVVGVGTVSAQDHLHCLVEISHSLPEPVQVEIVANVVFINFDEEFVAFEVAEPLDPTGSRLTIRAFIILRWLHCWQLFCDVSRIGGVRIRTSSS